MAQARGRRTRSALAEQALCPFLLEVECSSRRGLNSPDSPAEFGDISSNTLISQHADAECQRHRADVVSPLYRQTESHRG